MGCDLDDERSAGPQPPWGLSDEDVDGFEARLPGDERSVGVVVAHDRVELEPLGGRQIGRVRDNQGELSYGGSRQRREPIALRKADMTTEFCGLTGKILASKSQGRR